MVQAVEKYAKMALEMGVTREAIEQSLDIFQSAPQLMETFSNPAVGLAGKHNVIDKVFPQPIRNFLKLLCDNDDIERFSEVCKAYKDLDPQGRNKIKVRLRYVTPPDEEQLEQIRRFAERKAGTQRIEFITALCGAGRAGRKRKRDYFDSEKRD